MEELEAPASDETMGADGNAEDICIMMDTCGPAAGAAASEAEMEADALDKDNIRSDDALGRCEDATPKVRNAMKLPYNAPCT